MAWELLAIWAIIIATTIWFVRDEKRLAAERLRQRAQHFATAPAYRYQAPAPGAVDPTAELQRRFRQSLLR